ncbi:MAG: hypothetical protein IJW53_06360 [Clostridia bacterium]|nr:hypothetical protein [Clostridia bacterium]
MYDEELTRKICNLTFSKDEIDVSQTDVKYDTSHPFRKYYKPETIKGAMEKFISGEWDDRVFSHWSCIYCWILSGGCGKSGEITEDLNTLEGFFRDVICWDLDGLAFFSADYQDEDPITVMRKEIKLFEDYDHIWQNIGEWRLVYAMIGPYAEENEDQFVALINDRSKEYMIIYSDHIKNGFQDKHITFVSQEEFIKLIERLRREDYKVLPCAEKYFYMEIEDL